MQKAETADKPCKVCIPSQRKEGRLLDRNVIRNKDAAGKVASDRCEKIR